MTGQAPTGFSNRTYAIFDKQIQAEAKRAAKAMGRGEPNPEDLLRSALRIVDGLRILVKGDADSEPWKSFPTKLAALETDVEKAIESLIEGVLGAS